MIQKELFKKDFSKFLGLWKRARLMIFNHIFIVIIISSDDIMWGQEGYIVKVFF